MKRITTSILLLLLSWAAHAYGPYDATLVRIIDGDTVVVDVAVWPEQTIRTSLRLAGVDTPEKGWRAKCDAEREAGKRATAFTTRWLSAHTQIQVTDIRRGKYAGRVLGLITAGDSDLATDLIEAGVARPYDGGQRGGWCNTNN